jgi:hypothetical protein
LKDVKIDLKSKLGEGIEGEVFGCNTKTKNYLAVKIIKNTDNV